MPSPVPTRPSRRLPRLALAAAASACAAPLLAAAPAAAAPTGTHAVRPGDTVFEIAAAAGTTVTDIAAANGLADPRRISVGQQLTIPAPGTAPAPAEPATESQAPTPAATHTVQPGDTLFDIAAAAGTTVADLAAANALPDPRRLSVGQQLTIPGATAAEPDEEREPVASTFAGRTYPPEVTAAATANRDALLARDVPTRDAMRAVVADTARSLGVDPSLALAIAHQESGFDMRAVSPANAVGAMQVIPDSGRWASSLVGRDLDLLDAQDNATAGVAILRHLTGAAPDEGTAIAAYYQGLAGVQAHGPYPDTERYVASVQALRDRFR